MGFGYMGKILRIDLTNQSWEIEDHIHSGLRKKFLGGRGLGLHLLCEASQADVLPERLFNEDLDDGLKGGQKIKRDEFDAAVKNYYETRAWDPSGRPTTRKLDELGLDKGSGS